MVITLDETLGIIKVIKFFSKEKLVEVREMVGQRPEKPFIVPFVLIDTYIKHVFEGNKRALLELPKEMRVFAETELGISINNG